MHLPFSHIPELLLPVHCWLKLQNPPTGTVSEMINKDYLRIQEGKKKINRSKTWNNTAQHKKH